MLLTAVVDGSERARIASAVWTISAVSTLWTMTGEGYRQSLEA